MSFENMVVQKGLSAGDADIQVAVSLLQAAGRQPVQVNLMEYKATC